MTTENDDTQDNNDTQQQNDTPQQMPLTGNDASWDKSLDEFMKVTDRDDRAPAADKKQGEEGTQEGNRKQDPAGKKPVAGEGDNAQQRGSVASETQQVRPPASQEKQYGNLFRTNARGDIVDARGAVVAPSGGARAIFHKLWPHIDHYEQRAAAAETKLQNYEAANKIAKDAGLNLEDQTAALTFMSNWKKSPKETIKTMLQLAQNGGIDVSDIVQGGGGFNPAAVRDAIAELIDDRLKRFDPLVSGIQRQQQEEELNGVIVQQYNEFIEAFPDAKMHEESLANIMADKNVDQKEAYYILRTFAAENRLDWTKPLKPQVLAMQQQQQRGNNTQQRGPSGGGVDRDLPDMRGRGGSADTVGAGSRGLADVDEGYDSIARRVFAAHNIRVE